MKIVILLMDRGWVKVGYLSDAEERPFHYKLTNCRVIRRWGTTKGLAELKKGPTDATVLEELHDSEVPWRAVLDIIEVEQDKWTRHLS